MSKETNEDDSVERWAKINLGLSTVTMALFANSVISPRVVNVPMGILASELGHILVFLQAVNLYRLMKYNPDLFNKSWWGRLALGANGWSMVALLAHLWEALRARSVFVEAIQKRGIQSRAGTTSGPFYYLLSLVPLLAVSRRGKPLMYTKNIRYAEMSKIDPDLLSKWKNMSRVTKYLNMLITRGRISDWLSLDVVRLDGPPADGKPRVILMNIHGGAWALGDKGAYGLSTVMRLASRGIIVVTINYRMSPECKFPAHLLDCKRALIYVKQHAREWGGDPNQVFISGESAGGHLCTLMGVSANLPELQPPEFPNEDTSVAGCLPLYGIFDISGQDHEGMSPTALVMRSGRRRYFSRTIAQVPFSAANKHLFDLASPIHYLRLALDGQVDGRKFCPFFISFGTLDVLASLEDAEKFYGLLQQVRQRYGGWEKGDPADVFVVVPSGLHGFGSLPAIRAHALADAMADFITHHRID